MSSDSEILLAINKVLDNYQAEVADATSRSTWIKVLTDDRAKASKEIQDKLTQLGVRYTVDKTAKSSVPAIIFRLSTTTDYIFFKNPKGGGSGAGAALTKLTEASQALYCALAFHVQNGKIDAGDNTPENLTRAAQWADTDEVLKSMINDLPDDWIQSCIVGANKLYSTLKGKGNFTFHRGSKTVDKIEKHAWSIIRNEGAFGNLNKWSPADIYVVSDDFDITTITNETTLRGLNNAMFTNLKENKLIGVSLKKITSSTGRLDEMNFPRSGKVIDINFSQYTSTVDAMDCYLVFNKGKVQFRSFGGDVSLSGWQGEVKGASANQGKISLGPLNFILKRHGVPELPTSNESARLASANSEKHAQDIESMMKKLGVITSNENVKLKIMHNTPKYRYSKYLCLKLGMTMKALSTEKKDQVMEDIYLYASSQATYSAPYLKLQ